MAVGGPLGAADMILPPGSGKWVPAASFSALFPAPVSPAAAPAPRSEEIPPPAASAVAQADLSEALALSLSDRQALGQCRSLHSTGSKLHKINIAIAAFFTLVF